jgi:DNA-binding MarR family transcriptional regulator
MAAIVFITMKRYSIDSYIVDVLLPDLVGHDRTMGAFVVYLYLFCRSERRRSAPVAVSLQELATQTGLSKSTVQSALRHLKRRGLIDPAVISTTSRPQRRILTPWSAR